MRRPFRIFGLVALAVSVGPAQQTGGLPRSEVASVRPAQAPTIELEFGRFTISVSDSWTAQVFHIVDQLAQWDESSHQAYPIPAIFERYRNSAFN